MPILRSIHGLSLFISSTFGLTMLPELSEVPYDEQRGEEESEI
jgi:hypothetical protein